jgi:hypothetical protein
MNFQQWLVEGEREEREEREKDWGERSKMERERGRKWESES